MSSHRSIEYKTVNSNDLEYAKQLFKELESVLNICPKSSGLIVENIVGPLQIRPKKGKIYIKPQNEEIASLINMEYADSKRIDFALNKNHMRYSIKFG